MKKIVSDCDNTFGVKNCDVDDGLVLMYSLGSREAEFLGVTSTYGNSSLDVVQAVNLRMLEELGRRDILVKRGGEKRGRYQNEATGSLAEMADHHPGELLILATGSLTNLRGAYERDRYFFEKIKEIVLMGGIVSSFVSDKKVMNELNFSCNPPATRTVLTKGQNVSVMIGNNCLKVLFIKQEYRERFSGKENRAAACITEKTDYWFGHNDEGYGILGFYSWDVTVAACLMHLELFEDDIKCLRVSEQDLETGYLGMDGDGIRDGVAVGREGERYIRNLPVIREPEAFEDNIYETWLGVSGIRTGVCRQN